MSMQKSISQLLKIVLEAENNKDKIILEKLPYSMKDLSPVLSEKNLKQHYGILAKRYVERYNNNEGDSDFNFAGATLHNIFFAQLSAPKVSNNPFGISEKFINANFKDGFSDFKNTLESTAMGIQGSGWVYLSNSGKIKVIENHHVKQDIVLLIDWWEHSWFTDYGPDKAKYLNNIWRIINWSVINDRLNLVNKKSKK